MLLLFVLRSSFLYRREFKKYSFAGSTGNAITLLILKLIIAVHPSS